MEEIWRYRKKTRTVILIVDGQYIKPIDMSDGLSEGKNNSVKDNYDYDKKRMNPDRLALYRKIRNDYFKDKQPYKEGDKKIALFTGGGAASGKGTFSKEIDRFYSKDDKPIKIDPDDIKNLLKQHDTNDPEAKVNDDDTPYYHEESSALAKHIYEIAIKTGYPVLFDGTSAGVGSVQKKVDLAHKYGYKTECALNLTSRETALKNALNRFADKGRLVRLQDMFSTYKKIQDNLSNIAKCYDSCKIYDNSNYEYKLIGRSVNGKEIKVLDSNSYKNLTNQSFELDDKTQLDFNKKVIEIKKKKGW